MKIYKIKDEYIDTWSTDADFDGVVSLDEVERLAREWGKTVDELMNEIDEIENPIWYAVQNDPDDNDWGTGSRDCSEAREMAERYKEKTGFARIVTIQDGADPVAIDEEII